jgi:AcrR family transcriptional regulator
LSSPDDQPKPGLRERKKAKTRAAIQRSALRLFAEQGYEATTVEQIAEAAEVSPSTFFRYFPSKEDVALYDDLDPLFIAAFETQPAGLSPIQALRGAIHDVFERLPEDEMARQWERSKLILSIPELRMRMLDQFTSMIQLVADLIARRAGRNPDDLAVRAYAGAAIGALLAVMFDSASKPAEDGFLTRFSGAGEPVDGILARLDASLAYLEAGLPL